MPSDVVSSSRFCLSLAKSYRGLVPASRYENPRRHDFLLDVTMSFFTPQLFGWIQHKDLRLEIEQIKKKLRNHSQNIEVVFKYLDELIEKKEKPKPRIKIGYKA